jgi:pimeloyl-ACP methyl ester carboxylesterase
MTTVTGAGGLSLATTDHGGDGTPLLLTHGFGGERGHLDPIARRLVADHRVVTFDMRNHGESGAGEWTWPAVLADFAAVRDAHGLERPVVGGHSLGGMVGVLFAAADADTRAVINIDGHGQGKPDQYVGLDAAEVTAGLDRMHDLQVALQGEESAEQLEMLEEIKQLWMFEHYPRLRCPALVFNAVGRDPLSNIEGNEWLVPFMQSYRNGIARDLAAVAASQPGFDVETIEATHYLIFGEADAVADRIRVFTSAL